MSGYDIGVKVFHAVPEAAPMRDYIPVFHRWIQKHVLEDLLIDVADYAHMHQGPGVILVCHDAIYGVDDEDGKRGLLYRQRRAADGAVEEQLRTGLRRVLIAAKQLESEPELSGKVRFSADRIEVSAFNRLRAPHSSETLATLRQGALFRRSHRGERLQSPACAALERDLGDAASWARSGPEAVVRWPSDARPHR
jgi:hypothetical protein